MQKHSDQTVVNTGLYGVVRHPLYTGNLLFFAGIALWIGSLAGLLGVAVIFAATVARIFVEERHLARRRHSPEGARGRTPADKYAGRPSQPG